LDWMHIGATWQIVLINMCGGGDATYRCHYCISLAN